MLYFRWLILLVCAGLPVLGEAASARIVKVLPHYLDLEGRHMLSPSLYERDAYQAVLRQQPELCSGIRFDVNWKSSRSAPLVLRLQIRGSKTEGGQELVLETPVKHKRGRQWSSVLLKGEAYEKAGQLLSWRATLLEGEKVVAEQKSFLW